MTNDIQCDRELCAYPYEHKLGSELLCNFHYRQLIDPIRLRVARREHGLQVDTPLGQAYFIAPHIDFPLRFRRERIGHVVCTDRDCGATWTGIEGEVCTWCLSREVRNKL